MTPAADPTPATGVASLADSDFVSLTTFRKDGRPVATPVWAAAADGGLVVTTPAGSGKVKRLRRDPRVTLQPCSRRGVVPEGAPVVEARAEVVTDPARMATYNQALAATYGLQYRLVLGIEKVVALVRRRPAERVNLLVTDGG